ncbi:MAG TPA: cytochrome c peroxidase [Candidatus Binatia bacterium]|nr:cytochrome c peroxidase [Candidatus Binatia bacterium]
MEQRTTWSLAIAGALVALPLLAAAQTPTAPPSTAPPPPAANTGPHGALPMAEQRVLLEKMQPQLDVTKPPAGIDPSIWASIIPTDNAMTPDRVALGRKLYFDPRVSRDGSVACATCHDVSRGFTDQRSLAEGIDDKLGRRNSPTTLNAVFFQTMFLDGRAPSLEEQAKLPITNPIEMGQPDHAATMKGIDGDAEYAAMFQKAYGRAPNFDDLARAIAAFERTLVFLDSPFERFLAGDPKAISDNAQLGWALYNGKARCVTCHPINGANPIGSDNRFHNIGVAARHQDFEKLAGQAMTALKGKQGKDITETIDRLALETDLSELGRYLVTQNRSDVGAFKTLQVRNIGVTPPYMHDGSMQTLWDVIDHYNKGGEANLFLDGGIEPLALTEPEIDQLVELLFTMTDSRLGSDNATEMTRQRALATKQRPFRDDELAMRKVFPFETRLAQDKKKEN